jgi:hypothetical protein
MPKSTERVRRDRLDYPLKSLWCKFIDEGLIPEHIFVEAAVNDEIGHSVVIWSEEFIYDFTYDRS